LLARIAARWMLLGNDAETVARVKAPEQFFPTLDRLGIAHPATTMERPANGANWLAKWRGGAGGSHIVPCPLAPDDARLYFQQRVEGRVVRRCSSVMADRRLCSASAINGRRSPSVAHGAMAARSNRPT
jgi:hypothetical protein